MSLEGPEYCEECGSWATKHWGMDNTPLCDEDYEQAEKNYEATVKYVNETKAWKEGITKNAPYRGSK